MSKTCGGVFIEKSNGGVITAKIIIDEKSAKIIENDEYIILEKKR